MEAIPDLRISQGAQAPKQSIPRPYSARPYYSRRRAQSARRWLDESPQTTARTMESSEPSTARSLQDFFDDEDAEEEEQEEWVTKVNQAKNVKDSMKQLFLTDPETFYLYGQDILNMLQYRFEHKLDE